MERVSLALFKAGGYVCVRSESGTQRCLQCPHQSRGQVSFNSSSDFKKSPELSETFSTLRWTHTHARTHAQAHTHFTSSPLRQGTKISFKFIITQVLYASKTPTFVSIPELPPSVSPPARTVRWKWCVSSAAGQSGGPAVNQPACQSHSQSSSQAGGQPGVFAALPAASAPWRDPALSRVWRGRSGDWLAESVGERRRAQWKQRETLGGNSCHHHDDHHHHHHHHHDHNNKQALNQQELVRTRTWRRTTHQTARKVQNKRNKRSVSLSTSCGYIQSRKKERGHREELHVVGERETRGSEHRVDEGCKGESIHQLIFRVVLPDFTQVSGWLWLSRSATPSSPQGGCQSWRDIRGFERENEEGGQRRSHAGR